MPLELFRFGEPSAKYLTLAKQQIKMSKNGENLQI